MNDTIILKTVSNLLVEIKEEKAEWQTRPQTDYERGYIDGVLRVCDAIKTAVKTKEVHATGE